MTPTPQTRQHILDSLDRIEAEVFTQYKAIERLRRDLQVQWRLTASSPHAKEQATEDETVPR